MLDLSGRLVLPGLIDAHCHLDKTLYGGPWVPHSAGDALEDRIGNDLRRRGELGIPDVDRITALLESMAAAGTSHVRSHTDIDPGAGLRGVEAVRAAVERLDGRIGVEQVAFPQHGLLINPGTAELLDEALRSGVETVGGIDPAGMDGDPVRHLDILFDLAARHGAGIDLHLHDPGTLGVWELELIAERTRDSGLHGRVTVSHAYGFCQADAATQGRVIERLTEAGVTLVTAAVYSFPVPPIKRLRAAGANVACGHDGICDLWGPYGSGDMLERAMHVAYRSTFRRDEDIELALDAATYGGARALGLEPYGLAAGAPADLVVVAARGAAEAVVTHPHGSWCSSAAAWSPATGASSERREPLDAQRLRRRPPAWSAVRRLEEHDRELCAQRLAGGSARAALGLDRERLLERLGEQLGDRGHPLGIQLERREAHVGLRVVEPGARGGGADVAADPLQQLAEDRAPGRSRKLRPVFVAEPRAQRRPVEVLRRTAPLARVGELDGFEAEQHAHVVAHAPDRLAELVGDLLGARDALVQREQDAVPERMRDRLDQPGIELARLTRRDVRHGSRLYRGSGLILRSTHRSRYDDPVTRRPLGRR